MDLVAQLFFTAPRTRSDKIGLTSKRIVELFQDFE